MKDDKVDHFLGKIINDEEDAPDIVRADLEALGIDVQAARRRFTKKLQDLEKRAIEGILKKTRQKQQNRQATRARLLQQVQQQNMSTKELWRNAQQYASMPAHRNLDHGRSIPKEDIESYIVDNIAIEEE